MGLSKVDIPDTSAAPRKNQPIDQKPWTGLWKTVTNPEDIAEIIREANIKQYHQAYLTPFGSGPLADMVGRSGNTKQAEDLIKGDFHPNFSPVYSEIQQVVDTLDHPYPSTLVEAEITEEDVTGKRVHIFLSLGEAYWALQSSYKGPNISLLTRYNDANTLSNWHSSRELEKGYGYNARKNTGRLQKP
jgi:hypothetical protein